MAVRPCQRRHDRLHRLVSGRWMRRALQGVAVVFVLGLLGLLVWKVVHNPSSKVIRAEENQQIVAAPLFTKKRVDTGGALSLASLRGKVVVLNFWQSYCAPCTHHAPPLPPGANPWGPTPPPLL